MIPEVFTYIVNKTLENGRIPCNWTRTFDISAEIQLCLDSILQFRMDTVEEISVKIYVFNEMPAINLPPAMMQKISALEAVLDIDIIRLERDVDQVDVVQKESPG